MRAVEQVGTPHKLSFAINIDIQVLAILNIEFRDSESPEAADLFCFLFLSTRSWSCSFANVK